MSGANLPKSVSGPRGTPIGVDRSDRNVPNFDKTGICQDNSSTDVFAI
jgi:hypothetical protein